METENFQHKKRIDSVDVMRGLVMVVMALDHTRDFFTNVDYAPTDLSKASTALFLTRFITHYCAPTFIFLAGTGAFLSQAKGKTKNQLAMFLLTRGIWLIVLEVTLIDLGFSYNSGHWNFSPDLSFIVLQVFWALGVSMIFLAGLIYLPLPLIAITGLVMIIGHNALDGIDGHHLSGTIGITWQFLHVQSMVNYAQGSRHILIFYPVIPWIGVMALGYSFGEIFKIEAQKRLKLLNIFGMSAIALFIILRSFNSYGDTYPWADQHLWYRDILSFINVKKYPPSLDYLLITLGPVMLLLSAFENLPNRFTNILLVFGRVPLFYYLLHLYLLQLLAFITLGITKLVGIRFGFDLPVVYLVWATVVFTLYWPCRWFMHYKKTHHSWWLGYL